MTFDTVFLKQKKLIALLVLSFITVSMLLSSFGLFQSHGISLLDTSGHQPHGEVHASHSHSHDDDFSEVEADLGAVHIHDADNTAHGHNPLDHTHETASLPPFIGQMVASVIQKLVPLPSGGFFSQEPTRLERPPMPSFTL